MLALGWGIHDMALESWIFLSLGLSWEVLEHLRYLYPGHACGGACVGGWYYSEEFFKQPHESCLHLGQNLPKVFGKQAVRQIFSHMHSRNRLWGLGATGQV